MTIRDIFFAIGYEVDKTSESKVENSISKLKSSASKLLGAIGLSVSIAGIAKGIADCVSLSSEVEEMQNKFDVVFQGMTDEVEAWAQSYADAIGRNKNDIKSYLADQQNLLVGFGMTRQEGAELSKQMTTLALDLASFANVDETTAVNAMTKAIMGESEAAKTLGAVLNDSTREQAMYDMGLSGTYDSLDQLTKMQVNYQAILSQSADAVGDCERSLGSYASTMRSFQSKLKELKTLIGQFFMPTFQKVLSYGVRLLTTLRNAMQRITDFAESVGGVDKVVTLLGIALAALMVVLNFSAIQKGVSTFMNLAKAFGVAGAKALALFAIILVVVLLIQDFIAFMKGDNSLIGSLFDKAGIGAENARSAITQAWQAIKTFLLGIWEGIKSAAQTIFSALQAWWEENGESVKQSLLSVWEAISELLQVLWEAIRSIAESVFNALQAFWSTWGDTIIEVFSIIWNTLLSLIQPFLDGLAAVIDFVTNVFTGNWQGAWEAVQNIVASACEIISTLLTAAVNIIHSIFSTLGAWIASIWESIKAGIAEKITAIKETIVNGFNAAIEWIKALPGQAYQWGADIINSIVDGIRNAVGRVGEAVSGVASTIKSYLHFSEPDEGPLSDFHTYMPDMIDLMLKGISGGKKKVVGALQDITSGMSVAAQANIVNPNTVAAASGGAGSRSIVQNVNITNKFNGDRAGQQKSAQAMDKASGDATSEMARAIAFAR